MSLISISFLNVYRNNALHNKLYECHYLGAIPSKLNLILTKTSFSAIFLWRQVAAEFETYLLGLVVECSKSYDSF
jgi:hypothetical protein